MIIILNSSAVMSTEQQLRTADFQSASQVVTIVDFSDMKARRLPPHYADDMKFMKYFYPDFCVRIIDLCCEVSK